MNLVLEFLSQIPYWCSQSRLRCIYSLSVKIETIWCIDVCSTLHQKCLSLSQLVFFFFCLCHDLPQKVQWLFCYCICNGSRIANTGKSKLKKKIILTLSGVLVKGECCAKWDVYFPFPSLNQCPWDSETTFRSAFMRVLCLCSFIIIATESIGKHT